METLSTWRQLDVFSSWLENDKNGAVLWDRLDYDCSGHVTPLGGLVVSAYASRTTRMVRARADSRVWSSCWRRGAPATLAACIPRHVRLPSVSL